MATQQELEDQINSLQRRGYQQGNPQLDSLYSQYNALRDQQAAAAISMQNQGMTQAQIQAQLANMNPMAAAVVGQAQGMGSAEATARIYQIEQDKATAAANLEAARVNLYSIADSGVVWNEPAYIRASNQYDLSKQAYEQTIRDSGILYNQITGAVPTSSGGGVGSLDVLGVSTNWGDKPTPYAQNLKPGDIPSKVFGGSGLPDTGYVGGTYNPLTGETTGGHPSESVMQADRQAAGVGFAGGSVVGANAPEFKVMSIPFVASVQEARDNSFRVLTDSAIERGIVRPNFYDPSDLGDAQTQRLMNTEFGKSGFWGVDAPYITKQNSAAALALEKQLQGAYLTPGTRDDLFFANELRKSAGNPGELSSAYHHLGMSLGISTPANPFEFQGDIGIQLIAGTPKTARQVFSPVSMLAASYLPDGMGISDYQWETAKLLPGQPPLMPDFKKSIDFFVSATGQYGPYGSLYGGPNYIGTSSSDGIRKQEPFSFTYGQALRLGELMMPVNIGASKSYSSEATKIFGDGIQYNSFAPILMAATPGSSGSADRLIGGGKVAPMPMMMGSNAPVSERELFPGVITTGPMGMFSKRNVQTIGETGITTTFNDIYTSAVANQRPYFPSGGLYFLSTAYARMVKETPEQLKPLMGPLLLPEAIATPIEKGFNAFLAWSDYNKVAAARGARIESLMPEYNKDLSSYNALVSEYEKSPNQADFDSLMGKYAALKTKGENIDILMGDINAAKDRSDIAARSIVGNVDQKSLLTYPIGSWFGGAADVYRGSVENPIRKTFGQFGGLGFGGNLVVDAANNPLQTGKNAILGWGGSLVVGAATLPTMTLQTGQAAFLGGETLIRKPDAFLSSAAAGMAMAGQGMFNLGAKNPAELLGSAAASVALGMGVRAGLQRGIGVYRTRGMAYQPIESIGYDAPEGFPIRPSSGTADQLIQNFKQGTLNPFPKEMSISGKPPSYVPPNARLPSQTKPGEFVLWTAHESDSIIRVGNWIKRPARLGEDVILTEPGTSEIYGISAAPVAEGYFTKVGRAPESFGFDFGIGTPTIYSTIVKSIRKLPGAIGKNKADLNAMVSAEAAKAGDGAAFVPMIKAEFEGNLPMGTNFMVTGKNYYTKIGGFGKSHFGGIRVPIVELKTTGYTPSEILTTTTRKSYGGSSYKTPARITLVGLPTSLSGYAYSNVAPSYKSPLSAYGPSYTDYTATSRKATLLTPGRSSSIFGDSSPLTKGKTGSRSTQRASSTAPVISGTYYEASSLSLRRSYSPTSQLNYPSSMRTPGRYPSTPITPYKTPVSPVTRVSKPPTPPTPPVPPIPTPMGGFAPGGVGGIRRGAVGKTNWLKQNLIPDMEYLSRGASRFGFGQPRKKKGKKGGNPFAGGPF